MLPMRAVRLALGDLLATDVSTLAPSGSGNKVALIVQPFTLGDVLLAGDLTLASGNGLDPILCATGAQGVALDPISSAQVITLKAAAAPGFRWVTSGTFPPTINVYGAALLDNTLATLLAAMQLPNVLSMVDVGYQIDLDPLQMTFVVQPLS